MGKNRAGLLQEIDQLIESGGEVAKTAHNLGLGGFSRTVVNSDRFREWQERAFAFLEHVVGPDSVSYKRFSDKCIHGYSTDLRDGLALLKALRDSIDKGRVYSKSAEQSNSLASLRRILDRFPVVSQALCKRYKRRKTIHIRDEYDAQDLLYALLQIQFNDIRREEYTPQYAGASARMDILLKNEQIVVELKMTREDISEKEIGRQLIDDIARYSGHADCKTLVCFIYDPGRMISNPNGLVRDLEVQSNNEMKVEVMVRPI